MPTFSAFVLVQHHDTSRDVAGSDLIGFDKIVHYLGDVQAVAAAAAPQTSEDVPGNFVCAHYQSRPIRSVETSDYGCTSNLERN